MCDLSCHELLGARRGFSLTWYCIAYNRIESQCICCITLVYWSILIDLVILCFDSWVLECCENEWDMLCCDVMLCDKVVEWCDLCLSKLYLSYMMCISMLSCFSLLARNVITHFPCAICIWILWWFRILCSWEQMVRWMTMKNLMLEDAKHNVLIGYDIGV